MTLSYLSNQLVILAVISILAACGDYSTKQKHSVDFDNIKQSAIDSKGPLLTTHFNSLEDLSESIDISYKKNSNLVSIFLGQRTHVYLTHKGYGTKVNSILKTGLDENDIANARDGGKFQQLRLAISSPYFIRYRQDMLRVYILARRDFKTFGEGDAAFYDLAERMLYNIDDDDLAMVNSGDFSEKGYLNTFNHINAQVFMTILFSEDLADFVADIHERTNMKELVTGEFTELQLSDLEQGPVDNYVDMINNEWGQELGKELKTKYNISRKTRWTNKLLADVLNDIQAYYSWAFQIGFKPFLATDEKIIRFSSKLDRVVGKAGAKIIER